MAIYDPRPRPRAGDVLGIKPLAPVPDYTHVKGVDIQVFGHRFRANEVGYAIMNRVENSRVPVNVRFFDGQQFWAPRQAYWEEAKVSLPTPGYHRVNILCLGEHFGDTKEIPDEYLDYPPGSFPFLRPGLVLISRHLLDSLCVNNGALEISDISLYNEVSLSDEQKMYSPLYWDQIEGITAEALVACVLSTRTLTLRALNDIYLGYEPPFSEPNNRFKQYICGFIVALMVVSILGCYVLSLLKLSPIKVTIPTIAPRGKCTDLMVYEDESEVTVIYDPDPWLEIFLRKLQESIYKTIFAFLRLLV